MRAGYLNNTYNYFFNANSILSSGRLGWIDYAKGLTIILVVYHHSFLTLVNAGVEVNKWLINANLSVYSFRMPMFFMLSGLFIEKSLRKRGLKKYIEARVNILLYPYILWAIIQTTIGIIFSKLANEQWDLTTYLYIFYQPSGTSQLWYLITLFNTSVLYVIFKTKFKLSNQTQLSIGIVLYFFAPFLDFNSMIQYIALYYGYVVVGVLLSDFILKVKNFKIISSPFLLPPLGILMFLCQYYLAENTYLYKLERHINIVSPHGYFQHFIGTIEFIVIVFVGCAFILNICTILQNTGKLRLLRVIGYHSLYIYLMHVLIVVGIRILLVNMLHIVDATLLISIQIFVGVFLSVIIYNIATKIEFNWLFTLDTNKIFSKVDTFFKHIPKLISP